MILPRVRTGQSANALKQTNDPTQAGTLFSQQYERPAAGDAEAFRRGQTAPMFLPPPAPVPLPASTQLPPGLVHLLNQLRADKPPNPQAGLYQSAIDGQWRSLHSAAVAARGGSTTNHGPVNSHNTSTAETHVHSVVVNTQAKDADGISRSIGDAMKKNAFLLFHANTGLA